MMAVSSVTRQWRKTVISQVTFGRRSVGIVSENSASPDAAATVAAQSATYDEVARVARSAFQSPIAPFDLPSAEPVALDDEEAMRAFVGQNWSAYRRLWLRMRDKPGLSPSYGFSPALFGGVWLIFRKQYALGVGALAIVAAFAHFAPVYATIVALIERVGISYFGKSLVLMSGFEALARVGEREATPSGRLYRLSREGGVAWLLAALAVSCEAGLAFSSLANGEGLTGPALDSAALLARVRDALP